MRLCLYPRMFGFIQINKIRLNNNTKIMTITIIDVILMEENRKRALFWLNDLESLAGCLSHYSIDP